MRLYEGPNAARRDGEVEQNPRVYPALVTLRFEAAPALGHGLESAFAVDDPEAERDLISS